MSLQANTASDVKFQDSIETRRRTAIKGAFFSEFIDLFDIYLPVVVLTPVLGFFHPAHLSASMEGILASLVFITTLLGRPVGAIVFGLVADKIGRRMASIYSVAGFGVVTFLIAILPGYQSIGISSYLLLVLLRFVDGVFLGGGYTGAVPLAIEYSKKEARGFVGALVLVGFPAAYVVINLIAMLMFALFPLGDMTSPYAEYGWRIPFIFGALMAFGLAIYYVTKVAESEVWATETTSTKREPVPLSDFFGGKSGKNLLQVFIMMTGFWLTQNIITIFVPSVLLPKILHLPKFELTLTLLIAYTLLCGSYIVSGLIGQRIGRRTFFMILGPLIAVVGGAILYVLCTVPGMGLGTIIALVCLLSILVTAPWGMILTYINERFVTDVRATGFGVGYSLSVIAPSFYAFYISWLGHIMPLQVTSVALLCMGGLIGAFGAYLGPETKDVDF